jgi:hypothetical protein
MATTTATWVIDGVVIHAVSLKEAYAIFRELMLGK